MRYPPTTTWSGSTPSFPAQNNLVSYVFNVRDWGAAGDGVNDDTSAIQRAVTVAISSAGAGGRCVVYFPGGYYVVSTAIALTAGFTGRIAFVGDSSASAEIVVKGSIYGFNCDLTSGTSQLNVAAFTGLTFSAYSGTTPTAGIYINYAYTSSGDVSPGLPGPVLSDINFYKGSGNGFVSGAILNNSSHSRVTNVYGFGSSSTYDSGSGAGSGAMISYTGQSVNHTLSGLQSDFWYRSLSIVATGSNSIQGFEISDFNFTQSPQAIYLVGTVATDSGTFEISNGQVDNGNNVGQDIGYGLYATGIDMLKVGNFFAVCSNCSSSNVPVYISNCNRVTFSSADILTANAAVPAGIQLLSVTNSFFYGITFEGTGKFTNEITLDSGCQNVRVFECQTETQGYITPSDSGTGNIIGDNLGFTIVVTLTGGSPTETHYMDVTRCSLAHKPSGAVPQVTSSQSIGAQYNWDDGSNTATSIAIQFFNFAGGNLSAGAVRVTARVGP